MLRVLVPEVVEIRCMESEHKFQLKVSSTVPGAYVAILIVNRKLVSLKLTACRFQKGNICSLLTKLANSSDYAVTANSQT